MGRDAPDGVVIEVVVHMHENVSHAHSFRPGKAGDAGAAGSARSRGSFADLLKAVGQGTTKHRICIEIDSCSACYILGRIACGEKHVLSAIAV